MKLSRTQLAVATASLFDVIVEQPTAEENIHLTRKGLVLHGKLDEAMASTLAPHLENSAIAPEDLTKTFYAEWSDVTDNTRAVHFMNQVRHYLSTYGTGFRGEAVIPNANFGKSDEARIFVIEAVPADQIVKLAVNMLNSGIALKSDTVKNLLNVLDTFNKIEEGISFKNQEANAILVSEYGHAPHDVQALLRTMISGVTDNSLLIKSARVIEALKENPHAASQRLKAFANVHGIQELAENFNRYKPLFLAVKCNRGTSNLVNRIAKLSKKKHKPMKDSPINLVTAEYITGQDLSKVATPALLRAINAIQLRMLEPESLRPVYRIRNGSLHVGEARPRAKLSMLLANRAYIMEELQKRVEGAGKKVYIPEGVDYALPTSEKSFVGGIPAYTTITHIGELSAGIYWEEAGGALDLDLSAIDIKGGKVGWNSSWHSDVSYSGDITSAPNGAVEFMRTLGTNTNQLLNVNIYCGSEDSKYKLIVGTPSDEEGMMKHKDLMFSADMQFANRNDILGTLSHADGVSTFTVFNAGLSKAHVASGGEKTRAVLEYVNFVAQNRASLEDVLLELGYEVTNDPDEEVDVDLSPDLLTVETVLGLFL